MMKCWHTSNDKKEERNKNEKNKIMINMCSFKIKVIYIHICLVKDHVIFFHNLFILFVFLNKYFISLIVCIMN